MQNSVQTILSIFKNMGYKAYISGEKFRNMFLSQQLGVDFPKVQRNTILVSATPEQVRKTFRNHTIDEEKPWLTIVDFANEWFMIESMHTEIYYNSQTEEYYPNVKIKYTDDITKDFERQVFSINCIAVDGEQHFSYAQHTLLDINDRIIRLANDNWNVFREYPVRILDMFYLMAVTGFAPEKELLKLAKSNIRYLRFMPANIIGTRLRKIIACKHSQRAFQLMHKLGLFGSRCACGNDDKQRIVDAWHTKENAMFDILGNFRKSPAIELELWSCLFSTVQEMREELEKFQCFDEKELHTIEWLMNNKGICNQKDNEGFRFAIYNSIGGYERKQGIHYLKNLILKAIHIYKNTSTDSKDIKKRRSAQIMFNLCARPYFTSQFKTVFEELSKPKSSNDKPTVLRSLTLTKKEKAMLIPLLLTEKQYPINDVAMIEYYNSTIKNMGIPQG